MMQMTPRKELSYEQGYAGVTLRKEGRSHEIVRLENCLPVYSQKACT